MKLKGTFQFYKGFKCCIKDPVHMPYVKWTIREWLFSKTQLIQSHTHQ